MFVHLLVTCTWPDDHEFEWWVIIFDTVLKYLGEIKGHLFTKIINAFVLLIKLPSY